MNSGTDIITSRRSICKSLAAVLMLLLFLALQVFSASASLHHELHCDSHSTEHQCAITLLSNGQVDHATVELPVTKPESFLLFSISYHVPLMAERDYRIAIGRGPPVLF
ncbi:MAG: hypothetical protein SFY81_09425 [Verrucomicrobiota bacterium]|nr:hypothetical protein [Verrucomicrobiota bacterium]